MHLLKNQFQPLLPGTDHVARIWVANVSTLNLPSTKIPSPLDVIDLGNGQPFDLTKIEPSGSHYYKQRGSDFQLIVVPN